MATRPDIGTPWPQPTPPSDTSKGKRKWNPDSDQWPQKFRILPRQSPLPDQDSDSCGHVSNDVFSCFPTADSQGIVQNTWTRFVWNTALPQFSQTNIVDVYLFHGDSDQQVAFWPNLPYPQGHLSVLVNDTWWGEEGQRFTPGHNSTQTFYFVMVRNGADRLSQPPQSTFTATQTNFPNSILASLSSASVASSSAAAESSNSALSLSSALAASRSSASAAATANLQNASGAANEFPHWAIALLTVFGFLAFVAVLFVFWLLIRNIRSRKNAIMRRHSNGSQSPIMAHVDPQSPVHAAPGSSIAHGDPHSAESGLGPLPVISARHNIVSSDGASTVSRADSAGGPFSAVDAAAMATAFRNVMRKPDFADRPMEEGEGLEQETDVLNRELAEEGRDIRSVSSSRGVKVEALSDSGDPAQ